MLKTHDSAAIVGVSDLARARQFYGSVLGLEEVPGGPDEVATYRTGQTQLIVYQSEFAGTNQANAVAWGVGEDMEAIVSALKAKGVVFEHYPDSEWSKLDGDIHRSGDMMMVWFKDPDGNILHLNSM